MLWEVITVGDFGPLSRGHKRLQLSVSAQRVGRSPQGLGALVLNGEQRRVDLLAGSGQEESHVPAVATHQFGRLASRGNHALHLTVPHLADRRVEHAHHKPPNPWIPRRNDERKHVVERPCASEPFHQPLSSLFRRPTTQNGRDTQIMSSERRIRHTHAKAGKAEFVPSGRPYRTTAMGLPEHRSPNAAVGYRPIAGTEDQLRPADPARQGMPPPEARGTF